MGHQSLTSFQFTSCLTPGPMSSCQQTSGIHKRLQSCSSRGRRRPPAAVLCLGVGRNKKISKRVRGAVHYLVVECNSFALQVSPRSRGASVLFPYTALCGTDDPHIGAPLLDLLGRVLQFAGKRDHAACLPVTDAHLAIPRPSHFS